MAVRKLYEVAHRAVRLAAEEGVRSVVVGGLAVHHHGIDRVTYDVDLVVDEPLDLVDSEPLAIGGQRIYVDNVEVDLLWREGPRSWIYSRALEDPLPGDLPIARAEHLSVIKLLSGRRRDILDLGMLLVRMSEGQRRTALELLREHDPSRAEDFESEIAAAELLELVDQDRSRRRR